MATAKAAASARLRFTVSDDIYMLREVLAVNPFDGGMPRWTTIADNLLAALKKNFTPRAVRDRCDLLLAQFLHNDSVNLRKSGTEEQYDEKEKLLQEIADLAKEHGYSARWALAKKATCARPALAAAGGPLPAERNFATAARNTSAAVHEALVDATEATQSQDYTWSSADESVAEIFGAMSGAGAADDRHSPLPSGDVGNDQCRNPVLAAACSSQVPPAMPACPQSSISEMAVAGGSQVQSTPAHSRARLPFERRGRKRQQPDNLAFFQKRLHFDKNARDQELTLEEKRLSVERERLALERDRLQQQEREWDASHEERQEERQIRLQEAANRRQLLEMELEDRAHERRLRAEEAAERRQQYEKELLDRNEERRMFLAHQQVLINLVKELIKKDE